MSEEAQVRKTADRRPASDEYDAYYGDYISKVPEGNLIDVLNEQQQRIETLVRTIPESKLDFRYAPGKWTTREVVCHMLDTEWIFVVRALRIARGNTTPLPSMDQNAFINGGSFDAYGAFDLAKQFTHLRSAAIALFGGFDERVRDRRGTASGLAVSVRALMFIVAGHAEHHLGVLRERYLS